MVGLGTKEGRTHRHLQSSIPPTDGYRVTLTNFLMAFSSDGPWAEAGHHTCHRVLGLEREQAALRLAQQPHFPLSPLESPYSVPFLR